MLIIMYFLLFPFLSLEIYEKHWQCCCTLNVTIFMLIVKNSQKKLNAIFGFEFIQKSVKICWFCIQTGIIGKK